MFKTRAIPELSGADKRRFWDKVEKKDAGCWTWTESTILSRGRLRYGQFHIGSQMYLAHRISWSILHGAIPEGLQIDHICHDTLCVNPAHLHLVDAVRNRENQAGPNRMANDNRHSGFRGVSWHKQCNKWRVQVKHLHKYYYGGLYADVHEANRAAIALRNKLMSNNLEDKE